MTYRLSVSGLQGTSSPRECIEASEAPHECTEASSLVCSGTEASSLVCSGSGSGSGDGSGGGSGSWCVGVQAMRAVLLLGELAVLAKLLEVALPDGVGRWLVDARVDANLGERAQRVVQVRVSEVARA